MAVAGFHNFSCYSLSSVGEFRYDSPVSSSRQDDDTPKAPRSCRSKRGPEFVVDDTGSFKSGMDGSSSDGARFTSEDTDGIEIQCAGGSETEHEDNLSYFSESSDVGRIGKDRVRQVFQEWMTNGRVANSSDGFCRTISQWHCQNGGERVKVFKDGGKICTQRRNEREAVGYRDSGAYLQIDQVRNRMRAQRPIRRICGRQTLSDLLQRAQLERKGDLMALLERKPVSGFPHRNRIQAFLRGRFLRNEKVIPEKKPSSVALMELGMLKQRRTVTGLRGEFLTKSPMALTNNSEQNSLSGDENICESEARCKEMVSTGNHSVSDEDHHVSSLHEEGYQWHSSVQKLSVDVKSVHVGNLPVLDVEEGELNPFIETSLHTQGATCDDHHECSNDINRPTDLEGIIFEHCDSLGSSSHLNEIQGTEGRTPEELTNQWLCETSDNGAQAVELGGQWPNQDFQGSINSWMSSPSMENCESSRTSVSVHCGSEDIDRYTELRELCSRKRVSNLVQGAFGERLNRILQARVQGQGLFSSDLELDSSSPSLMMANQNTSEENEDQASAFFNAVFPFLDCFQDEEPRHHFSNQQTMDWVVVNDLRIEMARLQEKMNTIQNMLEDCLDMQSELQRSMQQEVSVSNHLITSIDESTRDTKDEDSNWDCLRRGICCVCRDGSINSLLYRCGHMCTCSRCAEELVQCTGKCPICSFPVLDTFQTS